MQGYPRLISMPQAVDCDPQAMTGIRNQESGILYFQHPTAIRDDSYK